MRERFARKIDHRVDCPLVYAHRRRVAPLGGEDAQEAAPFYKTLTLPGGETVQYTGSEALQAMVATIHQHVHPLLSRFLETDTAEGMPGLCRALVVSRSDE